MDTRNYDEPDNFGLGDCNCSEDNNCGCTYPNNIEDEGFSPCTPEDHCGCLDGEPCSCFIGSRGSEDDYADCANVHFDAISCNTIFCSQIKTEPTRSHNEDEEYNPGILVRSPAPDFFAPAVLPDDKIDEEFHLSEYLNGSYGLIFFYPMDFTFVCPSEIIAHDHRYEEFAKRNVKIVGISVDSVYAHLTWRKMPIKEGGIGSVRFPLVSDMTKAIAHDYGVLTEDGVALRASFLIDKDGFVRHQVVNDLTIGRNVDETLRIIDPLQFTEKHGNVCPAGWHNGEEGMQATPEGAKDYLQKNAQKL